jgi:hypothetical protein
LNDLFFGDINLSEKGINLRHKATYKKIILGNLETIPLFQRMKWSWRFGNVELAIWRCDLAMR